jgi:uncharacterized radical SAM protein YgiQ
MDIILITGEIYYDHPFCGVAILKRWLEKHGYTVGIISQPKSKEDIIKLGKPKLFYGITSGSVDSMILNYTPLKRLREDDEYSDYQGETPKRAVILYCNWVKEFDKETKLIIGGTEASLRRFTHYDYWDNKLRRPILFDSRADLLIYGNAEKQILEVAERLKNGQDLDKIEGTCIIKKHKPSMTKLPSNEEVMESKEKFCKLQTMLTNKKDLVQEVNRRFLVQYKSPQYTSQDLDEYYEMDFTREAPKELRGFEFSVVTHRGCIGNCNFCSLRLTQGDRIISRSEESIIREIKKIVQMPHFKGNIDDLTGPSTNMYGMDCNLCSENCLKCDNLDRSNQRLINLLKRITEIEGVNNVYIKSGIRYDLASDEYINNVINHHCFNTLRIAPEHVNKNVLKLMNKDVGDYKEFIKKHPANWSYYFILGHPGSTMKEAEELAQEIKHLNNVKVQMFTPTPMTVSTCMYYTGLNPSTLEKVYIPITYNEKKKQRRLVY